MDLFYDAFLDLWNFGYLNFQMEGQKPLLRWTTLWIWNEGQVKDFEVN